MRQVVLAFQILGQFTYVVPLFVPQEECEVQNDEGGCPAYSSEAMHKNVLPLLVDHLVKFAHSSKVTGRALIMLEVSDGHILACVDPRLSKHSLRLLEVDGSILGLYI